ncbi:MAG: FAD-dependent oxidoreductase, partial [bacterium]
MQKLIMIRRSLILLLGGVMFFVGCDYFNKTSSDVSVKNNWTVSHDTSKEKAQNEFDAIIIGSGIGGLTCASVLAHSGYKVLVLEQHNRVGGFCSAFTRDGFTFPAGPHDISGCDNGMVKVLLDELGLDKDDLFVLHKRTYMLGDKKISFTGTHGDVVQKLSQEFPKEREALIKFFAEAEKACEEQSASHKDKTRACPTLESWNKVTYQEKLDQYFKDPELKQFLCSLLGYLGTKPENTPAVSALMACLRYFIYGGHYPKRGGQLFAQALKIVIQAHGGTVLTETKVDKILVENNQ